MKKFSFLHLDLFEFCLWMTSVIVITLSFIISKGSDYLNLITSLLGVTSLIYLAKGYIAGQILVIIFCVLYGIISLYFRYYGEVITYVCMSLPAAIVALISWLKHPYKDSKTVEISKLSKQKIYILIPLTIIITIGFYFILRAFNTTFLVVSTISVTTSFVAAYLMTFRSPYYALAYTLNDIVLIILWTYASMFDINYIPMILCFTMFLFNDLYAFYNWNVMKKKQTADF